MIASKTTNLINAPRNDEGVEELSLFLPRWQFTALAEAAETQGMTVAQYMRSLLNHALAFSPFSEDTLHSA